MARYAGSLMRWLRSGERRNGSTTAACAPCWPSRRQREHQIRARLSPYLRPAGRRQIYYDVWPKNAPITMRSSIADMGNCTVLPPRRRRDGALRLRMSPLNPSTSCVSTRWTTQTACHHLRPFPARLCRRHTLVACAGVRPWNARDRRTLSPCNCRTTLATARFTLTLQ